MELQDTVNNDQNPLWPAPANQPQNGGGDKKIVKREGRVIEALPNAFFKVLLEDNRQIMGFLSGKMKLNRIKILPGDKVTIEMSPYDESKGRIVYRLK